MSDDLDIEGLDEAVKLVMTDLQPALRAVSIAIASEAMDRISPYPVSSRKPQAFKTAKQRRGFFAKLRSGAIRVPYRRSGDTLGRWSITPTSNGATLRNTSPHAGFMHAEKQAKYFQNSGWRSVKNVANEIQNDGTAGRMTEQAVQQAFDKGV